MSAGIVELDHERVNTVEAELITAIDTLLSTEPIDEEGLCPWCGEIRAHWAGRLRTEHDEACPWRRLERLFPVWVAD